MIRRLARNDRGQTTAMATAMLMGLILSVAVVVNVGQAINRRVALQLAADGGAYTGAAVMALGMNHLAYWNHVIQKLYGYVILGTANYGQATFGFPPPCATGDAALAMYFTTIANFMQINAKFASWPADEARRVTQYNLDDLFPGERSQMSFGETDWTIRPFPLTSIRPPFPLVVTWQVPNGTSANTKQNAWHGETPFDYMPFIPKLPLLPTQTSSPGLKVWTCAVSYVPPVFTPRIVYIPGWFQKFPEFPAYKFAWRVSAPRTKVLMFDSFFGPRAMPEMTAAAVAKAVGRRDGGNEYGQIKGGRVGYRVRMLPLSSVGVAVVQDPLYTGPGGLRPVTH